MYETLLSKDFVISRESADVYNKTAVADDSGLSLDITPALWIRVTISGFTNGTGTVTITGEDQNGDPASEVISFPANGRKLSSTQFSLITRVQTSNLTDEATVGTVQIESVEQTGELRPSFTTVKTVRGRLARVRFSDDLVAKGEIEENRAVMITKDVTTVFKEGDRVVEGGVDWEIEREQPTFYRIDQKAFRKFILRELESPAE